uniref:Cytochrome oxidase subunit II copper A binding domain-containing protein n=1 Tax=Strigamia maritima TaxID=126957 RepID=T1IKS9_STRMM
MEKTLRECIRGARSRSILNYFTNYHPGIHCPPIFTTIVPIRQSGKTHNNNQNYWPSMYSDFLNIQFDAYITPQEELPLRGFRLLDVDNQTLIPTNTKTRVLITAADFNYFFDLLDQLSDFENNQNLRDCCLCLSPSSNK